MTRPTKNDRTVTLTDKALTVYDSWPHMEKSKRVSEAIVDKHDHDTGTGLQAQLDDHEKRLRKLERKKFNDGAN